MAKQEMNNYLLRDVAEVYLKSIDGDEYFLGLTTNTSVAKQATKTLIKAGIGAKVVATMSVEEGYEITVETGLYSNELLQIQLGDTFTIKEFSVVDAGVDETGKTVAEAKTVKGQVIELAYGQFPTNMEMQLRTVAYDRKTNDIVADVYWIFDKVQPDTNFSQAFNMDVNNIQTVVFNAIAEDGSTAYGKYAVVPRDQDSITVPVTP